MRRTLFVSSAIFLVACLDAGITPVAPSPEDPYLGPRSTCSTGPAVSNDATFAEGPRESRQPVCVERCGEHEPRKWGAASTSPGFEAVPSGACTYDGEACSMVAVRTCACTDRGQAYLFECRCAGGTWACRAAVHGGDPCVCPDAG